MSIVILILQSAVFFADNSTIKGFASRSISTLDGPFAGREFKYRLYSPSFPHSSKLPLLVWLHGKEESGEDNVKQLRYLQDLIFQDTSGSNGVFVLAMQCPTDWPSWSGARNELMQKDSQIDRSDMIDITMDVIDRHIADGCIDPDRIVVAGICSGGYGVWDMAARYSNRLAAAAPISAAGVGSASVEKVCGLPIWSFHCMHDLSCSISEERLLAIGIRSAGGFMKITAFDTSAHDAWTPAFQKHRLLDWLLSQKRGSRVVNPTDLQHAGVKSVIVSDFIDGMLFSRCAQFFYMGCVIVCAVLLATFRYVSGVQKV